MSGRVAGNVVWNWSGALVFLLAGFVVAPYLVHRLGDTVYGLWILIASMTGYFGLLDLGVRGSVGRYVAFYLARGDRENLNALLSTAVTLLCAVGMVAMAATVVVAIMFFRLFEVPPEHAQATQWAIVIVGLNLAMTFPISAFDGVLWGQERFDLINAIDIPTAMVRTAITFWLIRGPDDILMLAWLTLAMTLANESAKCIVAFRIDPQMRLSVRRFARRHAAELYGYGLWQFLRQIARQTVGQIGPLIIGAVLSVAAVTPYSVASRLIAYAGDFLVAATGVLTPLATALHARDEAERERRLFINGGKWCTVFATFCGLGLLGLGRPLLVLWMGEDLAKASIWVLVVLTLGELLAMSQWLTYSILLGKARHRAIAIASILEGVLAGVGGYFAARFWGTIGVCAAFAIAAFIFRGAFQIVYACRVLREPLGQYLLQAIARPMAFSLIPAALLAAALYWHTPASWLELFTYGIGFALVYAVTVAPPLGALAHLPSRRQTDESVPAARVEAIHG